MCPRSIAGVPSSQALLGYLITTPPSVCVPDVLGVLGVWIQNQKMKKEKSHCKHHDLSFCSEISIVLVLSVPQKPNYLH